MKLVELLKVVSLYPADTTIRIDDVMGGIIYDGLYNQEQLKKFLNIGEIEYLNGERSWDDLNTFSYTAEAVGLEDGVLSILAQEDRVLCDLYYCYEDFAFLIKDIDINRVEIRSCNRVDVGIFLANPSVKAKLEANGLVFRTGDNYAEILGISYVAMKVIKECGHIKLKFKSTNGKFMDTEVRLQTNSYVARDFMLTWANQELEKKYIKKLEDGLYNDNV